MIVKVSPKFRGELVLGSLNRPLKPGEAVDLSAKEMQKIDIQLAIKRGWLISNKKKKAQTSTVVAVKDELPEEVVKEKEVFIDNMIEEVDVVEVASQEEHPTHMAAYDMEQQRMVNIEESEQVTLERHNIKKVPAAKKEVDFTDDESGEVQTSKPKPKAVKKSTRKKKKTSKKKKAAKAKVASKLKEIANDVEKTAKKAKTKAKAKKSTRRKRDIIVDTSPSDNIIIDTDAVDEHEDGDVDLVDREQQEERRLARQKLQNKELD